MMKLEYANSSDTIRVLVVEDDLCLKPILNGVLKSIDTRIKSDWCSSAEEAVEKLKGGEFNLIMADHFLKGEKTGLDLWSVCFEQYHEIPFILMTGIEIESFFHMVGTEAIIPMFLPKPFLLGECRKMIEGLIHETQDSGGSIAC